ncbi:hypothetical protein [Yeosuana sp.]|uniref:hypothetical protein n=1 Tax=Yeosuana sp. TaxID=2529388 RepID=UPI004055198A|tara:strand:+ start:1880 stop:2305 length:426 start_codon:yes stop_codon:yes gene_type:complete
MRTRIKILALSTLTISLLSISCNNSGKKARTEKEIVKEIVEKEAQHVKKEVKLKTSFVCFVNNNYMGIEQIPVEVEGKTYYGCCEDCVGKLKNLRETRYAIDPLTGTEVDKATAYIVLKPNSGAAVLYFQSEENYLNYIKS